MFCYYVFLFLTVVICVEWSVDVVWTSGPPYQTAAKVHQNPNSISLAANTKNMTLKLACDSHSSISSWNVCNLKTAASSRFISIQSSAENKSWNTVTAFTTFTNQWLHLFSAEQSKLVCSETVAVVKCSCSVCDLHTFELDHHQTLVRVRKLQQN